MFPRALQFDGEDWEATTTGLSHQVDLQWSTQIRFSSGHKVVFGRINVAPENAGRATDTELLQALDDAINNPPPDMFPAPPAEEADDDRNHD